MGRDCASELVPIALAEGPEDARAKAPPDERRRPLRATLSALAIGSAMPRDGSLRLSDVETPSWTLYALLAEGEAATPSLG